MNRMPLWKRYAPGPSHRANQCRVRRFSGSAVPFFLLILIVSAFPPRTCADEILIDNGDRISGKILAFSREAVQIQNAAAGVIQIHRNHINALSLDDEAVVELDSGERMMGRISAGDGRTVLVQSSLLGARRIDIDHIDNIQIGPTYREREPAALSNVVGRGSPSSRASGNQATSPGNAQQQRPIGQKPPEETDIRKIFLRQAAVLLRPGQIEVEAAPSYLRDQSVSPFLNAKLRQFRTPVSARIGLFPRGEGYITVPVAYIHRELAFAESAVVHRESGLGDAAAGLNLEIAGETARRPDIIASVSVSAPSGSKPDEEGLSLGSGHWEAAFGVQLIKTVDPVALFGGISYTHLFDARYYLNDGVHSVDPGVAAGYNFGFGFAVNENISLSAQVAGSYQAAVRADGAKVFGSSREPLSLRTALTYRYSRKTYVEPSLTIGLDDDTPDFILGISLTHRFGK